ncbi:deoxyribodipyrimidine photo-lyase, partial [Pseudomonas tremae]
MQLIWLRSDLRVHDNTALTAALQRGPTLAVYLLSPAQWRSHDDADCKVDFWLRNLVELEKALGKLNVPLLIREADIWDKAPEVLSTLCKELKVEGVHLNQEYGVNETRRDQAVQQTLEKDGIHVTHYLDQLLFKPGSILTKTGNYFQVFTQFKKVCYTRLHEAMPRLVRTPPAQQPLSVK